MKICWILERECSLKVCILIRLWTVYPYLAVCWFHLLQWRYQVWECGRECINSKYKLKCNRLRGKWCQKLHIEEEDAIRGAPWMVLTWWLQRFIWIWRMPVRCCNWWFCQVCQNRWNPNAPMSASPIRNSLSGGQNGRLAKANEHRIEPDVPEDISRHSPTHGDGQLEHWQPESKHVLLHMTPLNVVYMSENWSIWSDRVA